MGRTTAARLVDRGLADVGLIDVIQGWPEGLALDLKQSAPIQRFDVKVTGSADYRLAAGSNVLVVTAGAPRSPGMTRMDLLTKNQSIVQGVAEQARQHCPDAIAIVVTNPLDEMVHVFAETSGFPKDRVMGMAGILDSARLCSFVAEELGISPLSVDAMTLGSHGEDMVPLTSLATVDDKPLSDFVDAETIERLYKKTVNAGAEIVQLLGKGSAFYAPSAAVAKMVNAIVNDSKEVLPVCAWVEGQYGITGTFVGVPARLGRKGVEEIVEYEISEEELTRLRTAAEAIKARCADLKAV